MRELGATAVEAWVGPHICGACYEVPEALQSEVAAREPASLSTTSWGTPALDIGAGVRAQLARAGVDRPSTSPAAPWSRRTSTPTAATGRVPAGSPG